MTDSFSTTMSATIPVSPSAGGSSDLIKDSSTSGFQADVMEASIAAPVLVDFWAPWCGPCKQLGPTLEKVVSEAKGKVKLVKINIDENTELATKMGVRSIPAVFAFSGGQPVDGFMGALPESEIRAFVHKVLEAAPSNGSENAQDDMSAQIEQALIAAEQALTANDIEQALHIFGLVLQQMPEHTKALCGLARTFVKSGALEQARETLNLVPQTEQGSNDYKVSLSALALAEEAEELGEIGEIQKKIKANPDDLQARLDLAILHNAAGDFDSATEALIEVIKRDREWNEDAARTKLLEFFDAWGATSPQTIAGRKALSRTLFS